MSKITQGKFRSLILEALHETAIDLHRFRSIHKRNMHKFDVLCLPPFKASLFTVRKWESGEKHPSGPSLKLLSLLDCKGLEAVV